MVAVVRVEILDDEDVIVVVVESLMTAFIGDEPARLNDDLVEGAVAACGGGGGGGGGEGAADLVILTIG